MLMASRTAAASAPRRWRLRVAADRRSLAAGHLARLDAWQRLPASAPRSALDGRRGLACPASAGAAPIRAPRPGVTCGARLVLLPATGGAGADDHAGDGSPEQAEPLPEPLPEPLGALRPRPGRNA
jgi:hypothetical protein